MGIKENLFQISKEIGNFKDESKLPQEITIIAVSKRQSEDKIIQLYDAGQRHFGESRVQEAEKKISSLKDKEIIWHFIGALQSNKAKKVVQLFDYIHSIDKINTASKINNYCQEFGKKLKIFVQVNTSGEGSKSGINPEELEDFVSELRDFEMLEIIGLMTIGPLYGDEQDTRQCFRNLNDLRQKVNAKYSQLNLKELSMGMSSDYLMAIQEGATFVRIGTKLFGCRE